MKPHAVDRLQSPGLAGPLDGHGWMEPGRDHGWRQPRLEERASVPCCVNDGQRPPRPSASSITTVVIIINSIPARPPVQTVRPHFRPPSGSCGPRARPHSHPPGGAAAAAAATTTSSPWEQARRCAHTRTLHIDGAHAHRSSPSSSPSKKHKTHHATGTHATDTRRGPHDSTQRCPGALGCPPSNASLVSRRVSHHLWERPWRPASELPPCQPRHHRMRSPAPPSTSDHHPRRGRRQSMPCSAQPPRGERAQRARSCY